MFFNKPKTEIEPVLTKADPYAKLKQFYLRDIDGQTLILSLSNQLKASNAFILYDDGTIWKASYIGEILDFLNNTIQQIGAGMSPNTAMAKWLGGELPANINPQAEIGPHKIINYAVETIRKYPTTEYLPFLEPMENFKLRYDECEIVQNLNHK